MIHGQSSGAAGLGGASPGPAAWSPSSPPAGGGQAGEGKAAGDAIGGAIARLWCQQVAHTVVDRPEAPSGDYNEASTKPIQATAGSSNPVASICNQNSSSHGPAELFRF